MTPQALELKKGWLMALGDGTKAIIREIAREVIKESKEHWDKEIDDKILTHKLQCSVNKDNKIKELISSIIGGVIVAVFMWILK